MQPLSKPRLRRLNIRLSQQEWDQVKSLSSDTTCRNVSEYARLLLLDKPVRVFYRNPSLDNFEESMSRLLTELEDLLLLMSADENCAKKTEKIKEAIIRIVDQYDLKPAPVKE